MGIGTGIGLNKGRADAGFIPNALSTLFDGVDDFAETSGDVPALNSLTRMTWSLWFKYTSLAVNQAILAKWDFNTQGSWVIQSDQVNSDEIKVFTATSIADGGGSSVNTNNANLTSGVWHHLALVYDGNLAVANRVRVYIDSVLKTLDLVGLDTPTSLTNGSASVKVGKFGGILDRNLGGNVDEIGIFPTVAFNQTEVNEIYNSGVVFDLNTHSQSANLNNYWRMGDGSTFPTIRDEQGNNALTMTNMAANDFVLDVP